MAHSSPREGRRLIVLPDQGDYKVLQVSNFHVIQDPQMSDFAVAKANMIESQIRPSGVTKASIINAIAVVPRERFVPRSRQSVAYVGGEIEVAPGRCLLDPTVFARMIAAAEIQASDLVLDVGCATGYSTAVLAALCDVVMAVEEDEALAAQAQEVLGDIGIDNCAVVRSPLAAGKSDQGPYDVIFVNGAVGQVSDDFLAQLADGGRMVAIHGAGPNGVVQVTLRTGADFTTRPVFNAAAAVLPGFIAASEFAF